MIQSFMWAFILTSHFGALLTIDRHSLPVPVNSATHFFLYRNETSYLLYMIPVQNVVIFHTGTNVSYQYKNRSDIVPVWLVPLQHFIPVSCKRIQSYKWAPECTRTRMKLVPVSFKHPLTFSQLDLMEEYMAVTQDVCRSLKANLEQLQVSEALTGYTNLLGKHTLLCVFKVKRAKWQWDYTQNVSCNLLFIAL